MKSSKRKKTNLILTGMSGAGKSTLGVLCAKALGFGFVDTDIIIQRNWRHTLPELIKIYGNDGFIEIESETLKKIKYHDHVIATGGSAVYLEETMNSLKETGTVLYIEVDKKELISRLKNIKSRGIVISEGEGLEELIDERIPLYEKYADIKINCSNLSVEESVEQIVAAYKEFYR